VKSNQELVETILASGINPDTEREITQRLDELQGQSNYQDMRLIYVTLLYLLRKSQE